MAYIMENESLYLLAGILWKALIRKEILEEKY